MSLGNRGNGVRGNAEIFHWAQIYLQDKVCPSFFTRQVSNLGRETFPTQESERVDLGMHFWFKKFILGEYLENIFLGVSANACWAALP